LQVVADQQSLIDGYKLTIAQAELDLATYEINSEKFVVKFINSTEATIAQKNRALQREQRRLELWESLDTGIDGLEQTKAKLIADTVEASEALKDAEVRALELESETVTASEAKETAKAAYDAVVAEAEVVNNAYLTALDNYNTFLSVTAGGYFYTDLNYVTESGWLYNWDLGYALKYWDYNGVRYYAPANPYIYSDLSTVTVYEDDNIQVQCLIDLDYPDIGDVDYVFYYYNKETVFVSYEYEYLYSSVEDYEHHVEVRKSTSITEIAAVQKSYDELQQELNDSIASLKLLAAKERTLYKELQDSTDFLAEAEKTLTTALENYNAAYDKYTDDPTPANLNALDIARTAYEGLKADGSVVEAANGGALGDRERAIMYHNNALDKYNVANYQYDNTNYMIKSLVSSVILAKNNLDNTKTKWEAELTAAENTLEALKKLGTNTTREKLEFALQAAKKASDDMYASDEYNDALSAYNDALSAYYNALSVYSSYVSNDLIEALTSYEQKIEDYAEVEYIQFQIDLGGTESLLKAKANKIVLSKTKIAELEADIKIAEEQLKDVTKYSMDEDKSKVIAAVIAEYQNTVTTNQGLIKKAEAEKAKAEKEAEYYDAAIKAFLKELGE
jgi:hypothetical protein